MTKAQLVSKRIARRGERGMFLVTPAGKVDTRSLKSRYSCSGCGFPSARIDVDATPLIEYLNRRFDEQGEGAEALGIARRNYVKLLQRRVIRDCCADRYATKLGLDVYQLWGDEWAA